MSLQTVMTTITSKLKHDNEELAACLKKWTPFLIGTVNKIKYHTGRLEEDILHDILLGLIEVNNIYYVPLYRYDGKLWEIKRRRKEKVHLVSPRNNKTFRKSIWVEASLITKVKKGKLESTIYREINQQAVDIINAHFTQKNGFEKISGMEKVVIVRSGKDQLSTKKKLTNRVIRIVEETTDDSLDCLSSNFYSAEASLIYNQYLNEIWFKISDVAKKVLVMMLEDPGISNEKICKFSGLPSKVVCLSRYEIIHSIPFINKNKKGYQPIYISADQVCI